MRRIRSAASSLAVVAWATFWAAPLCTAQTPAAAGGGPLLVGTKEAPPFAMKGDEGQWTGISIELWREIANRLDLRYELREYDLEGLLAAVRNGEVAAGVAALTITEEREEVMDFTHPIYTTGFAIAVAPSERVGWRDYAGRLFSLRFLGSAGLLALVLLLAGTLLWLAERRANPEQFGGKGGIFSGFWWAAVTMTTVGYGDKTPKTVAGKVLGIAWMFVAIVLIGIFIASMTSALTVSQLQTPIVGPDDLRSARVASVAGTTSEQYLRQNRIPVQYAKDLEAALRKLARREVDAVVYDAPLLRYLVSRKFQGRVEILAQTFGHQDYCIALPTGSPLREPINRVLLADATRARLRDILFRYLEQAPAPPARPQEGDEGE